MHHTHTNTLFISRFAVFRNRNSLSKLFNSMPGSSGREIDAARSFQKNVHSRASSLKASFSSLPCSFHYHHSLHQYKVLSYTDLLSFTSTKTGNRKRNLSKIRQAHIVNIPHTFDQYRIHSLKIGENWIGGAVWKVVQVCKMQFWLN